MTVRVAVTGAAGFLGWHLQCHARTRDDVEIVPIARDDLHDAQVLAQLLTACDAVVHLAGANRASDSEVEHGNERLARQLIAALNGSTVKRIVHANSVHRDSDTSYGRGKARAAHALSWADAELVDVVLPHLFGEHGRPSYNSFVATFAYQVALGQQPTIQRDTEVELLHAQDASRILLDAAVHGASPELRPSGSRASVRRVAEVLQRQAAAQDVGELPDLTDAFEARLYNQLRSYGQPFSTAEPRPSRFDVPRVLTPHTDDRGALVEVAKARGGPSQTFFSTTRPDVTRGNHFHTRKVERFCVLAGEADITLRRLGDETVHRLRVSGSHPCVVDIPTLHAHAIANVGQGDVLTAFWTDEVFDPADPDTFAEMVEPDA